MAERAGTLPAAPISPPGQSDSSELDAVALENLFREFSRMTSATGTIDTSAYVSREGIIVTARVTGGTAPAQAKERWRRMTIGKRLFKASLSRSARQEFTLPTQEFGK
jgi:hypothetical protein